MKAALALGVSTLALTVLTACGGVSESGAASKPKVAGGGGERATDFQLVAYQGREVLGGQEVSLSALLSQGKPVVLNMWAGLCPPCRVEMPDLQEAYEEYTGRALLVGLDVGPFVGLGSREDGRVLLQELKVTYPNGTTFDPEIVRSYKLLGLPTTFFIKPTGEIHRRWTGLLTKDKLTELVEELIVASASPASARSYE